MIPILALDKAYMKLYDEHKVVCIDIGDDVIQSIIRRGHTYE